MRVLANSLAGGDRQILLVELETRRCDFDGVLSRGNRGEAVRADGVRERGERVRSVLVAHCYADVSDDCTGRVDDDTAQRGATGLGVDREGRDGYEDREGGDGGDKGCFHFQRPPVTTVIEERANAGFEIGSFRHCWRPRPCMAARGVAAPEPVRRRRKMSAAAPKRTADAQRARAFPIRLFSFAAAFGNPYSAAGTFDQDAVAWPRLEPGLPADWTRQMSWNEFARGGAK